MFFLVALAISLEKDAPRIGNATIENGLELIDVQKVLAANTTFTNCSFQERVIDINYYSGYKKDTNSKDYVSNITFVNCDFSNAVLYGSTGNNKDKDFFLDFNMTIINSTIGKISNNLILRFRRLCFMNCTINVSTTSMYSTPELEFRNCTFIGKPSKQGNKAYFVQVYANNKDCVQMPNDKLLISFSLQFFDCIFDLDSKWNYKDLTTKTNERQFIYIDNAQGAQRTVAFLRCVTGNNMLLKEDPLHFIRLNTVIADDSVKDLLRGENINIFSGKENENGIGFALSTCQNDCFSGDYEEGKWESMISRTGYERPPWKAEEKEEKEKKDVPWKAIAVALAAIAVILLIMLTVTCIKKRRKNDRLSA